MNARVEDQAMGIEVRKTGFVYLIGAGPGDPELLTLKAQRVLDAADVILYDDLVSSDLVAHFSALKIYTGKRKNCHHFEQDAINQEILRHAREGKIVARLKGGDPFIFGRGGEELEVMRQNGIGYEIIPGITAAHGASAYTEIPLTMRKISSSVAFCTGHPVSKLHVPNTDTIVYYMVASTVREVLDAVAKKGWSDTTPVAVVQNATRYNQNVLVGSLGEFRREEKPVYSPALLLIGENIAYFIKENWYSKKKKVLLVGGDAAQFKTSAFVRVHFPCLQAQAVDPQLVACCMQNVEQWSVVCFADEFAIQYFFKALFEASRDVRHLANTRICALNTVVAVALQRYGLKADVLLEAHDDVSMSDLLQANGMTTSDILLPMSTLLDDALINAFEKVGNKVTALPLYSLDRPENEESLDLDFIDEIYFASPVCLRQFKTLYAELPQRIVVKTADDKTQAEYLALFCGDELPATLL